MTTKECKNEIFTLESRELNEGKLLLLLVVLIGTSTRLT